MKHWCNRKTTLALGSIGWGLEGGDPQEGGVPSLPVLFRERDHFADADTEHAEYPRGEAGCTVQEVRRAGQSLPSLSSYPPCLWKVSGLLGVGGGTGTTLA